MSDLFKKFPSVPMSSRLFPTFSSIRLSVSGFMLRPLIHSNLSSVQGDNYGSIFIFLHTDYQLDKHHLLKMFLLLPMNIFGFFDNIKCPYVWGFISGSSILFHWSTCLFLYQYHAVFYHYCSVVQLEVRDGDSSRDSFIVENHFQYAGSF